MQLEIKYYDKITIHWIENNKLKTSRHLNRNEATNLIHLLRNSNDVTKQSIRIRHQKKTILCQDGNN